MSLEKRAIKNSNKNKIIPMIYFAANSPVLMRDLLLSLNKMYSEILSISGETESISVFINKNIQFDNFNEITSCFLLFPVKVNISFCWANDPFNEKEAVPGNKIEKSKDEANSLKTFIEDTYMSVKAADYFSSCDNNFLDIPVSTKVWARGVLKGHLPGSDIICVHFPELTQKEQAGILGVWDVFFRKSWKDFSHVHFIVFNSLMSQEEELLYVLPNVTFTKMLGYSLLEEFALVRLSDMYVGAYDKYAAAVIGTNKPFMLIGNDGIDKAELNGLKRINRGDHQIWLPDISTPEECYSEFSKFYSDVNANQKSGPNIA